MREETFIMIKPDTMERKWVYEKILEEVEVAELIITNKSEVILNEYSIMALWGYLANDYVMKELLRDCMQDIKLDLLSISGENAIVKVDKIKKRIRSKYALNSMENCMHAPHDKYEYIKDIEILTKAQGYKNRDNIIDIYKFARYGKVTLEELSKSISDIRGIISENDFFERYVGEGKWRLYLYDDNEHIIGEVAAVLYETLPGISIAECYAICIMVGNKKKICVRTSDDNREIETIREKISFYGIKAEIE